MRTHLATSLLDLVCDLLQVARVSGHQGDAVACFGKHASMYIEILDLCVRIPVRRMQYLRSGSTSTCSQHESDMQTQ